MSAETLVISAVVDEGATALRTLYAQAISAEDFSIYDEEFGWIEQRIARKKPINRRIFRQRFPDFEWMAPVATIKELAEELKEERAFEEANALLATLTDRLERDNALDLLVEAKERINLITRAHMPMSDFVIEDEWRERIKDMHSARKLAKAGIPVGLSTGFAHLDHHFGGLMPGQMIQVLGRTGEGKSMKVMSMAVEAKLQGATVGIFTPEHDLHEVTCRMHTIASARKEIQEALGLDRSFRHRALLFKHGFNLKTYERFCEYYSEELPGRVHLLAGKHRPDRMSVGYIEDRVAELGLDVVFIDPIYLLKPVRFYRDNPTAEVGAIAYAVEALSETYNLPVVFTNQSNRQGGQKQDAPHKDTSYNSDQPNHVADYVLGVKHISDENKMICRCTKSRNGETFRYELAFFANTGMIRELTPLHGSYLNGKDPSQEEEEVRQMVAIAIEED